MIRTVLFDLDGTLADTAPDLAWALNEVLAEEGRERLPFAAIRPHVSHGGKALIEFGFDITEQHGDFPRLRQRLLDIYEANLTRETKLFSGMVELLSWLEEQAMPWGVVTNKPEWLTLPLMEQLHLRQRSACIVGGDTVSNRKPHPEPMLLACTRTGSEPAQCLYVGDAQRDIEAGHNAGMKTVVALYGYLGSSDRPESWGADTMVASPLDIRDWVINFNRGRQ